MSKYKVSTHIKSQKKKRKKREKRETNTITHCLFLYFFLKKKGEHIRQTILGGRGMEGGGITKKHKQTIKERIN